MIEALLITFTVFGTCFINYKLFNVCIKKAKYDDIPELNEIKKKMEKEEKKSNQIIQKIIDEQIQIKAKNVTPKPTNPHITLLNSS